MKCFVMALGAAVALFGPVAPAHAAGKPGSSDLPLTVQLRDDAADGVRSDNGAYTNGQDNVRAVLVGNDAGNFVFDTNDNSRVDGHRRLILDFHGQPVSPFDASQPIAVDVFLGTLSGGTADGGNLRLMRFNDTLTRRGPISWVNGNTSYSLRFHGQNGAGLLLFTCVGENGAGACNQWTVDTTGAAQLDSTPTKGSSTQTIWGVYDMPFRMVLTTVQ